MIDWRVALVVWGGFLILALLTRYVSLGSSSAGVTVPISTWLVYHDGILLLLSIIIGGLHPLEAPGEHPAAAQRGPSPSSISIRK